jgi:hypothetical protein
MKNLTKILFIFTLICFFLPMKAQTYYDTQWKKLPKIIPKVLTKAIYH